MYHIDWQELIELGTELDTVDGFGDTALIAASKEGNIEMVKLLHEAKADLNACDHYGTALHRAVHNGHTEMLKVMHNEPTMEVLCCNDLVGQVKAPFGLRSVAVCRD